MKKKKGKDRLSSVCEDLVDSLVAKELEGYGTDNMTCIVVEFKK
jgi:serine/threonine protein phosphatase PrpC